MDVGRGGMKEGSGGGAGGPRPTDRQRRDVLPVKSSEAPVMTQCLRPGSSTRGWTASEGRGGSQSEPAGPVPPRTCSSAPVSAPLSRERGRKPGP